MAETPITPPYLAWGLYRERIGRSWAMEWRELGPVFTHADGSGGYGHFKSLPTGGWNHRFTFRRYGEGPPPLPVLRGAPKQQQHQPPTDEPDDEQPFLSGDDAAEPEPSQDQD
jgi:hypothetical protein